MANIALLIPNDELFRLTHDMLQEQLAATDCPKLLIEPVGRLCMVFANAMDNKSKHSQEKLGISKTTLWRKLRQYQII